MTPGHDDRRPAVDPAAGCAREPIHVPGSIQPHGHLLAFEGDGLGLAHASAAAPAALLVADVAALWGEPLECVFAGGPAEHLKHCLARLPERGPVPLGLCRSASGEAFQAVAHRSPDGFVVLEVEAVEGGAAEATTLEALYPGVRDAFGRLGRASSVEELAACAAAAVRGVTGFDRALVYRFEENWDGIVVAEDGDGRLPSYLGLRFPASDIPAQARRLYELNPQRLIADAGYAPVPILSARHGGPPLDLTYSALRSVSPVHLEYMRNMGTPASMSVSLLRPDGRLWGLISCHHATPRRVPFAARNACDLIGQMLSVRVTAREETRHAEERARLKGVEGRLLAHMAARGNFVDGLVAAPKDLTMLAGAAGAAVLADGGCVLVGRTPPETEVRRIAEWLARHGVEEAFETTSLASLMPEAEVFADAASGLLAVPISRLHASFLLWFRPEVVRTVSWGGDPRKMAEPASGQLNPRRSFEAWAETVRLRSAPWTAAEVEAVRDLRTAIVNIVLRAAEERAELTGRLERVNGELAAFSYSVSHDLRAPFRHITGYAELLRELEGDKLSDKGRRFLSVITEAAETAGRLVDALLNFSQMGRSSLANIEFDPAVLVAEVRRAMEPDLAGRRVEWRVASMPGAMRGDPAMLRQVFQNLLSNAVKYTRSRAEAVVEVGCEPAGDEFVFHVRDNGAGFDMAYAHKLFGVFQRLHRQEEFEGVGIGLANVRRIVERHGGRAWAEGKPGQGATFFFTLPRGGPPTDAR
ncbi:ATP-binding protein [Paracraurococcus lichenis]|uniref:histidine kinase n=1 Tax=Paracraurococcus lichenis TaxID=3064888 RepID=A0ABT9EBP1_9PROT|nr:ATP-binding protein [Paracraurococcus sp. LOR1-02]MDO9713310.1 ATP-binding protein [Paracraurococcus sp. LOR1-02]